MAMMVTMGGILVQHIFHTLAQTTPFQIVYGREPPPVIRYGRNSTSMSLVEAMLEERDAMLEVLKSQLLKVQKKLKQIADGKR